MQQLSVQGTGPQAGSSKPPRLSIGVPVYNEQRYLDACIRSIVEQSYTDLEVIICDNASTDRTPEIAESWARRDPRVSVHRAGSNVGAAGNFNWCFQLARGELFKWCAADDLMQADLLRKCVDALDAHPDAVMAFSGALDIDANDAVIGEIYDNQANWQFHAPDVQVRTHHLVCTNHSCISVFGVMRSAAAKKSSLIGPYVGSDRTLLLELGLQGPLLRVADDLLLHREHEGRSIRKFTLRERTVWFDSRAKGFAFPSWRIAKEYFRAVATCDLPMKQKARCCAELLRWIKWHQASAMWGDISFNAARAFGGSRKAPTNNSSSESA